MSDDEIRAESDDEISSSSSSSSSSFVPKRDQEYTKARGTLYKIAPYINIIDETCSTIDLTGGLVLFDRVAINLLEALRIINEATHKDAIYEEKLALSINEIKQKTIGLPKTFDQSTNSSKNEL